MIVVDSCYVSGTNAELLYGNIQSQTHQYYSFPIILRGLNDVATFSYVPYPEYKHGDNLFLYSPADLVEFFKRAQADENDYHAIVSCLGKRSLENNAQIKLVGREWFSPIDPIEPYKKIVSIGSILAKTRSPHKPLDIVSFFKKDPQILALYSDNIPFELKINSHNIRAIVSMVSSDDNKEVDIRAVYGKKSQIPLSMRERVSNWIEQKKNIIASSVSSRLVPKDSVMVIQRIKKISSTTHSFSSMREWFELVNSGGPYKWFFIDEISDREGLAFKDVLMVSGKQRESRPIFYYKNKNNHLFKYQRTEERVAPGSHDEKYYNERIDIIRNQYPKLSEKSKQARNEITPDQIKNIQDVLIKKHEKQKTLRVPSVKK